VGGREGDSGRLISGWRPVLLCGEIVVLDI
jgi:hypothetical protein